MGNAESSSSSDSEADEKKPNNKNNKISTDEGVFSTKQKKEMVENCWLTAKNFGRRVYRRMFQKSSKFELVLIQIAETNAVAIEEGAEEEMASADLAKWEPEARRLEQLLDAVVRNLQNSKVVMELCVQFGRGYADWHRSGLKSQFWSDLGESVVGEALCLEGAAAVQVKQRSFMIEAWTHLGSLITDNCRNGYYSAMRDRRNRRDSGTVSSAYSTSTLFTEDSGSSV